MMMMLRPPPHGWYSYTYTCIHTNVNHKFLCFRFKLQMYYSNFFIFIYLFKITRTKTVRHSHLSTQLFITDGNIRNITFLLTYFNTHYARRVYLFYSNEHEKKTQRSLAVLFLQNWLMHFHLRHLLCIFLILPSSNNNNNTDETRHINRWLHVMKILLFIIMETVQKWYAAVSIQKNIQNEITSHICNCIRYYNNDWSLDVIK